MHSSNDLGPAKIRSLQGLECLKWRATYGRDVVDGGCGVRENTELRFTLGVGVIGHLGSPATVDKTRNVFVRVSQTGGNKTCRLVMVNLNTLSYTRAAFKIPIYIWLLKPDDTVMLQALHWFTY
jgi:hypothetical protein